MKMHALITASQQHLDETTAAASPLTRAALGILSRAKGETAEQPLASLGTAWQDVADAAKALARTAQQGALTGAKGRRLIAYLVRELEGALAVTGAMEGVADDAPAAR